MANVMRISAAETKKAPESQGLFVYPKLDDYFLGAAFLAGAFLAAGLASSASFLGAAFFAAGLASFAGASSFAAAFSQAPSSWPLALRLAQLQ